MLFSILLNILLLLSSSAYVSGTLFNIPFVFALRTKRNRLLQGFFPAWQDLHRPEVLGFYKLYHNVNRSNLSPDIFLQSDLTVFLLVVYIFLCFLSLFPDWFYALFHTACRLLSIESNSFRVV